MKWRYLGDSCSSISLPPPMMQRASSSRARSSFPSSFPQAGEEPGLEEESPAFAATVEERRKERPPRLDWAGLLKRTESPGCVRVLEVWRQAGGVGVREGSRRGESDCGAPGVAPGECAPGPCARAAPERGVLKRKPPQPAKRATPLPRPAWEGGWAGVCLLESFLCSAQCVVAVASSSRRDA
jgi:hypothetical protein